jgi:hypothetical protein
MLSAKLRGVHLGLKRYASAFLTVKKLPRLFLQLNIPDRKIHLHSPLPHLQESALLPESPRQSIPILFSVS